MKDVAQVVSAYRSEPRVFTVHVCFIDYSNLFRHCCLSFMAFNRTKEAGLSS